MKIDIHVHTKKIKSGDPEQRNIEVAKFAEIIKSSDVKIIAITNHNHFDHGQYISIRSTVEGVCQIWPGIELDILEDGRPAHLLVIVNPKNSDAFADKVAKVLSAQSADNFAISIANTVKHFDSMDVIYVAHYHSKKPNLIDKDVDQLLTLVSNKKRVLKEATNSISAGIYIRHGHNSIYGSDVHDWDEYLNLSKELPELRLPVESFEQFCLLLERDDATIKTLLDKKSKESIQISPFGIGELLELDIYNDINIIFGSKGTGKTEILRALSNYYNQLGFKTRVYESSQAKLDDVFDIKGAKFNPTLESLGIDDCVNELQVVRNATEKGITSLSSYVRYYSAEETNKISKSLKLKNFTQLDEKSSKRNFDDIKKTLSHLKEFEKYCQSSQILIDVVGDELFQKLKTVLEQILAKVKLESEDRIIEFKAIALFNDIVKVFVAEIAKKTGLPEKPIKTGFSEYASNRINLEKSVKKLMLNILNTITPHVEYVGDLGEKGKLHCQTNVVIQSGNFTNGKYETLRKVNKFPQKNVAVKLEVISKCIYSNALFEKIAELKSVENGETISSIGDLVLFHRHFTLNDQPYSPSNGESSMVLLHNELMNDKEIYLIDEPEKSLGNDYISEVIVPLIKERAKSGRKLILATHDANIAVRTLPYNSIYREHGVDGYHTYAGNPFSNSLICKSSGKGALDWKLISMKTLEGGRNAFGERGKIYGNT